MYHCECVGGAWWATGGLFGEGLLLEKVYLRSGGCVVVGEKVDGVGKWVFDDGVAAVYPM